MVSLVVSNGTRSRTLPEPSADGNLEVQGLPLGVHTVELRRRGASGSCGTSRGEELLARVSCIISRDLKAELSIAPDSVATAAVSATVVSDGAWDVSTMRLAMYPGHRRGRRDIPLISTSNGYSTSRPTTCDYGDYVVVVEPIGWVTPVRIDQPVVTLFIQVPPTVRSSGRSRQRDHGIDGA